MRPEEFFVYYLMIPLAQLIGIFGNGIGLLVFSRKSMSKIGPIHAYRYLLIADSAYLIQMFDPYFNNILGKSLSSSSDLACRITSYIVYSSVAISPMLVVYISVEKLISIKYPAKRFMLRKKDKQLLYLLIIIAFNFILFSPVPFFLENKISFSNTTNRTTCSFKDNFAQTLIQSLFLVNKIVPFLLMSTCSILLIISVFRLRQRIEQNFLSTSKSHLNESKRFKKDIRLAFTSILMNVIYLLLNIPVAVVLITPSLSSDYFLVFSLIYLFYFSFSLNFYLILFSNNLTRKELRSLFK